MSQEHQRKRAQSRGSTASIHSIATQSNHERSLSAAHHNNFQEQWHNNSHGAMPHAKNMAVAGHQMGQQMQDDEMLRPATQMPLHQSFAMDAGVHQPVMSAMHYSHHPSLQQGLPTDSYVGGASFTDTDGHMMDRDDPDENDMVEARRPNGQKAASNRTSANNELEMRQLYQASKDRSLEDVAKELHGNERGPNSERTRQVFAMLWYVRCVMLSMSSMSSMLLLPGANNTI